MSPETRSPVGRMRRVSRNPWHFRTGRWALLAEGLVLTALGATALCSAANRFSNGVYGVSMLGLTLAPWHSALLGVTGVGLALSALRRRASLVAASIASVAYLLLVFYGAAGAVHHAPGPLGLGAPSIVLHGIVSAVNLGILYWLLPDALEGPAWARRRRTRRADQQGTGR